MKAIRNIVGLLVGGFLLLSVQSCILVESDYPSSHRTVILRSRAPYYYEYRQYRPYNPPPYRWTPYHKPPGHWKNKGKGHGHGHGK